MKSWLLSALISVFASVVAPAGAAASATVEGADAHPPCELPPAGRSEFVIDRPLFVSESPILRFRSGDDPAWADPGYDDSDWEVRRHVDGLPARSGIFWVRFTYTQPRYVRDGLSVAVVASYELYIDGRLVGRSGRVGADRDAEIAGPVDNLFQIPDDLATPGERVVALRMSAWRTGFPTDVFRLNMASSDFRSLVERRMRQATSSVLAVGGAGVICVVFALWWFVVERQRVLWMCSALGLAAAVVQLLQAWRWLWVYPYDWHYPRLVAIAVTVSLLGVLLVAALLELFALNRRWGALVGVIGAVAAVWIRSAGWYHQISYWALVSALITAALIALRAWSSKRRGAVIVLVGLAGGVFGVIQGPWTFLERNFYLTFGAPMGGIAVAAALRLRDERRAARQARLTAARLEIELLKKQIQPHFVLNTLTTIMEVIEQSPSEAVQLIDALAREFRMLARVSSERLIPLEQEVELCLAHLEVMSRRRAARCSLLVEGETARLLVPPALLLTLVENGLTHAPAGGEERVFRLRVEKEVGRTRLIFHSPGTSENKMDPAGGGTGLRYVKARLEESFAGRWSVESNEVEDGWRTIVEIRGQRPERGQ
jgi:hypothetical protein